MVKDIQPGSSSSSPRFLVVLNGVLFFSANDGIAGTELWQSDGTSGGTLMVKDIRPGSSSSSPQYLTVFSGKLYFSANDGIAGIELWQSDGTPGGTSMVKDINPSSDLYGPGSSSPSYLTVFNGKLFFFANDGTTGRELWKSDGTPDGTALQMDFYPGNGCYDGMTGVYVPCGQAAPSAMAAVNGKLFISALNGSSGYELWSC